MVLILITSGIERIAVGCNDRVARWIYKNALLKNTAGTECAFVIEPPQIAVNETTATTQTILRRIDTLAMLSKDITQELTELRTYVCNKCV